MEKSTDQAQSPQAANGSPSESQKTKLPASMRAVTDAERFKLKGGRNLIVCLDGTGDKFDADNSNIVHFVSCLKKDDPTQVTYYQSGIGTYDGGGLSNGVAAGFDMAVGSGLGVHVRDAYKFVMATYKEHDRICLFGFSRGAYTARCLAGMLHKVGLLPAHNSAQVPFAYQFYKDETPNGFQMSSDFKKTFCQDVNVHFLGLFDSVASVGFIPRKLPLSSTPTNQPAFFRHAMALDEHRAKFKVCRFKHAVTEGEKEAEKKGEANGRPNGTQSSAVDKKEAEKQDQLLADGGLMDKKANTDVLEVWFMGAHADVGGGAVKNEERHKLSQIPLRWMIRQCFECNTGILFHTARLADMGLDIHMLFPTYQALDKPTSPPPQKLMDAYEKGTLGPISRRTTHLQLLPDRRKHHQDDNSGQDDSEAREHAPSEPVGEYTPEQVEDYFDAMSPINDQLVQAKGWWILELWPIKVRVHTGDMAEGSGGAPGWKKKVSMNMGRYRPVQDKSPNLHWTVKQRMHVMEYKNRVRTEHDAVWREVV